jgi:hypothetical protein
MCLRTSNRSIINKLSNCTSLHNMGNNALPMDPQPIITIPWWNVAIILASLKAFARFSIFAMSGPLYYYHRNIYTDIIYPPRNYRWISVQSSAPSLWCLFCASFCASPRPREANTSRTSSTPSTSRMPRTFMLSTLPQERLPVARRAKQPQVCIVMPNICVTSELAQISVIDALVANNATYA